MDMIIDVDDEKIEILKLQSDCEKQWFSIIYIEWENEEKTQKQRLWNFLATKNYN
jgi:hypothetical protein